MDGPRNVLGTELEICCVDPLTGWHRDGWCRTEGGDLGLHVVCAQVTDEFLDFTASRGNDLRTPHPEMRFPGLADGDRWCVGVMRWKEALEAGAAPPLVLESTHIQALEWVDLGDLESHAVS